jgi:hypothetical protein
VKREKLPNSVEGCSNCCWFPSRISWLSNSDWNSSKRHGSGSSCEVEEGDECSVGKVETSKDVRDMVFICNRLACSSK